MYDSLNRLAVQGEVKFGLFPNVSWAVIHCLPLSRAEYGPESILISKELKGTGYKTNLLSYFGEECLTRHIVNYYDNYDFRYREGFNELGISWPSDTSTAQGHLTGQEITDLSGSGKKQYTTYLYNRKGEIVSSTSKTWQGFREETSYEYTFTGKVLARTRTLSKKSAAGTGYTERIIEEKRMFAYDGLNRLSAQKMIIPSQDTIYLARYTYDRTGRLESRAFNNSPSNTLPAAHPLCTGYGYNIRGWISEIRSENFSQKLYYQTGKGAPRYGGSISSMTWQVKGDSLRSYKFTYDGLDRMKNADYGEGTALTSSINRFSEQVAGYDKNGNILSLRRYGRTGIKNYGLIDDLTCTLNGNRLKVVSDATAASPYNGGFDFRDAASADTEYSYDENGNLTQDLNKNISSIQYNCLNLPEKITFADGSLILHSYGADGTKWRTIHRLTHNADTIDYCADAILENGVIKRLSTEVGYISFPDKQPHYYLKDHQGNVRVVADAAGAVKEVNHYYPFGGIFDSSGSVQPYKYNGKELDRQKGLNWYDYGARQYDAALGRWHAADPLAEKYYSGSPYTYCLNNPIRFIDPDGKEVIALDGKSQRNITNTLTKKEVRYVKFGKDGVLNVQKLNKSKSRSKNFNALKALANSDTKYKFEVVDKDVEGQSFSETYKGLTAFPDAGIKPSLDDDVLIQTSTFLTEKDQAQNVAHEAYGHAYFFELNKTDKSYDYNHKYVNVAGDPEWDSDFKIYIIPNIRTESNERLKKQIEIVTKQAGTNYDEKNEK